MLFFIVTQSIEAKLYAVFTGDGDGQSTVLSHRLEVPAVESFTSALNDFVKAIVHAWVGDGESSDPLMSFSSNLVLRALFFIVFFKAKSMERALELFTPDALGVVLNTGAVGTQQLQDMWEEVSESSAAAMVPTFKKVCFWMEDKGIPSLHDRVKETHHAAIKEVLMQAANMNNLKRPGEFQNNDGVINAFDQDLVVEPSAKRMMLAQDSDDSSEGPALFDPYHSAVMDDDMEPFLLGDSKPAATLKQRSKVINYIKSRIKEAMRQGWTKISLKPANMGISKRQITPILRSLVDQPMQHWWVMQEKTGLKE